ncbi:MAG: hypothetical protein KJP14_06955 [Eudoraea sp.]|nr:hypothetical protein [Eudoraea sp.]
MTTLLHLKEIYLNAFRQFSNYIVRNTLKVLAWFAFAMFLIVLYAFWYRIFSGFPFD